MEEINGFPGIHNKSRVTERISIYYLEILVPIYYFRDFSPSEPRMAKESSLQTFFVD